MEPCGTVVADGLDVCGADIVAALTHIAGDLAGDGVLATPRNGTNGSQECYVTRNGDIVSVLTSTGEPATRAKLEQVAGVPGCPSAQAHVRGA